MPFISFLEGSIDVDASYKMVFNAQHEYGLQSGRDLILTFGPLAFLVLPTLHPTASVVRIVILVPFYAILLAVFWLEVAMPLWRRSLLRFSLFMLVAVGSIICGVTYPLLFVMAPAALLAALSFAYSGKLPNGIRLALLTLMAIAAYTKFTQFIAATGVVILVAAYEALKLRRIPLWPILYVGVLVFVWLLAGQSLSAFPLFVQGSWELASAYGSALVLWGGQEEVDNLSVYLAVSVAFVLAVALTALRREAWLGLFYIAVWSFFVALGLKAGFVRYSSSHVVQGMFLLALATWIFAFCQMRFDTTRLADAAVVCVLVASFALIGWRVDLGQRLTGLPERTTGAFSAMVNLVIGIPALSTEYEAGLASIRKDHPVPQVSGSVDVYSSEQAIAIAYGFDYRPRPSFQTFNTVSTHLARRNADHLRSRRAPKTIFFRVEDGDRRLPSLGDSLSWPELWSRYRWIDTADWFLILQKRAEPLGYRITPLGKAAGRFDEPITVPTSGSGNIWAVIDVQPSIIGRLATLAYKVPILWIFPETPSGRFRYRFMPEIAEGGFLLSPLLSTTADFGAYSGKARGALNRMKRVSRITIKSEFSSTFFKRRINIRWFELTLGPEQPRKDSPDRHAKGWHVARDLLVESTGIGRPIILPGVDNDQQVGLRVTPPFVAQIVPPDRAVSFGFRLEVEEGSWRVPEANSDGVDIELVAVAAGEQRILFAKTINPKDSQNQRGPIQVSVPIDSVVKSGKLELRVMPRGNGANDNTNLFDFSFD